MELGIIIVGYRGLGLIGFRAWCLEFRRNEKESGKTAMMGYMGTTIRIHSFILSYPKGRITKLFSRSFGTEDADIVVANMSG